MIGQGAPQIIIVHYEYAMYFMPNVLYVFLALGW